MCFVTSNTKGIQVAKEDIVCYKILSKTPVKRVYMLSSPYYSTTRWEKGKVKRSFLSEYANLQSFRISKGFHSLITISVAKRYRIDESFYSLSIYKFIIPKGASYYKNKTQYISNKIYLHSNTPVR